MAKSRIRQWVKKVFRGKKQQPNDKNSTLKRNEEAGPVSAIPKASKLELGNRNIFQPPAFPPAWANEWGEDQYGLYADLQITSDTKR
ncbi:MAG: hypothetical protein D3923_15915, partial [Candidatus Electrothrix sp. AR3]|nr:hypothetical protein [Candidatus Electrothrix sp. AR3]